MNRFFTLLLAASSLTAVGQYEVGDVGPAGGWIFYVDSLDEFDWDYLEVASSVELPAPNWGGYAPCETDGSNSLALGSGAFFSAFCLGEASPWTIASLSTGGPGALVNGNGCSQGGYGDWFLPSLEELDQIRLAFGDDLVNMIAWDDYVPNIFSCWTSSFYHLDNCSIRGIHSNILDGSYGGQESTGNHWGSGDYLRHQVLPIRSFSKANEAACGIGTIWDPTSQTCIVDESACGWQPDGNGDGLVGLSDLLDFLTVYGDTDYDQDGIWDSADDCVGEYDQCGVCNGSGPSIPIIESIEILYDSVYAEPIDDWFVFETGADTTYQFVCEYSYGCTDQTAFNYNPAANSDDGSCIFPFEECGDAVIHEGEVYSTVAIGDQCWYKENVRFLPAVSPPTIGSEDDGGAHAYVLDYFGTDLEEAKGMENFPSQGSLFNYVALVEWDICPVGWHLPTDEEFQELELFLGIDEAQVNQFGLIGVDEAALLKASPTDTPSWNGTNDYGFSAIPSGSRWFLGESFSGPESVWFSTSDLYSADRTIAHRLYESLPQIERNRWGHIHDAHSVRCIKDTE